MGKVATWIFAIIVLALAMFFMASLSKVLIAPTSAQLESNCIDAQCSNMQGKPTPCPEGTYSIGLNEHNENICKADPTGCPYGDSIPLGPECDKFAPQPATNYQSGALK